jgi:hypothetical protein
MGQKGNAANEPMMSAFHPIANEQRTQFYVGFVPEAEVAQNGIGLSCPKFPARQLRAFGQRGDLGPSELGV